MISVNKYWKLLVSIMLLSCPATIFSQSHALARVKIAETAGINREGEYVQVSLQTDVKTSDIVAVNERTGESIYCQTDTESISNLVEKDLLHIVFPVSVEAGGERSYILVPSSDGTPPETDLSVSGEGLELIIENEYYRADLTRSAQTEAKNHASGQLRELINKVDFEQVLYRTENRMHWAPNFQKANLRYYTTIAGWDNPVLYRLKKGPYLVRTERQDKAPAHPEILLTASYDFYASKPYFIFYSEMEVIRDVWLSLLRNDEMTMDSLFTHVAFQRPDGEIVDLPFDKRYEILKKKPLENDAPWLCFYHSDSGHAFGSIRLKYDNTNRFGESSPTWLPHTKISDGAEGGKYWNRRLIHEHLIHVPEGNRYVERNAYLVFRIEKNEKFKSILLEARLLQNPLWVNVIPY